ncbi:MAG: hypothetical protein P8017_13270 [Deltaproteobacteria bacterium]
MKAARTWFLSLGVTLVFVGVSILTLEQTPNNSAVTKVWKAYVSYSNEHPCQLYLLGFFKKHPNYKQVYAGKIATKLLHETSAVLSSRKNGTKNTTIILILKYDQKYFVFLDLSLENLHLSLGWREIGESLYLGRQKMLVFDKDFKLVAIVSDQ